MRAPDYQVDVSLVSFNGATRWSFRIPFRPVLIPDELPAPVAAGDFTGDGIPDYVFSGTRELEGAPPCGPYPQTWSALYFIDGATGEFTNPLPPIDNKCWDFPHAGVTYPTHRYPGSLQIGDLSSAHRGYEVASVATYPPDDRGRVLNFAHSGTWTRLVDRNGVDAFVFPSSPDFGPAYNDTNPGEECKKPLTIKTCHVPDSHVPTGLIVNSQGARGLFLLTTGRALIYRDDLTPTADTVWSSGDTPNAGRNYGRALAISHGGRDYASLIGGCSVQAARTAMRQNTPPTGQRTTSLNGADAHCGIHRHFEWFALEGSRISDHRNRYYSYSVSDGFFHNRPEFPGAPVGPIGGRGSKWTAYNLFDAPHGSEGELEASGGSSCSRTRPIRMSGGACRAGSSGMWWT